MEQMKKVEFLIEMTDIITYALQQNGQKIVKDICLKNVSENDMNNLMLKIKTDVNLIIPFEQGIQELRAGEDFHLRNLNILIKGDFLASLTEKMSCILVIELWQGEEILISESRSITALAFDECPGLKYFPDLLAAFVTPNHPVIAELLQKTSNWLEKWTGNPSLEGYQSNEPNRIKNMAAAAYAAIQEKNITYANPPASFETIGQRVRLCDSVVEQHLGTCMDMTLLYASVLEAIGLNPILVLLSGHIFAGVWLADESFADPIVDDPSQLEKRMANGIHEILVVECTAMCAGHTHSFDDAVLIAKRNVGNYGKFAFAIDVLRARRSGVRPLPIRVHTENGYKIKHEDREEKNITIKPEELGYVIDTNDLHKKNEITKQTQWERKLLDLSMRNMLINMRLTKAVVPLLSADVGILEDALADGEEFQVTPRPLEWDLANINVFTAETVNDLGPYKDLIALECKHRRLPTIYSEKELNSTLMKMYRSAKTSMEENGASTLYLALGLLRWFERKKGENQPRYAPIVLIPIDITRKSASKGYVMRMRDEDAQVNITLLEFLKQNFDIIIGGLNPIPTDEHGLDLPKIFTIIRHAIMDETMWDVIESGFIGNFSFSQFVMWNDIHGRTDFLDKNKIVHSLMQGVVGWDCKMPENIDKDEAYLPITADSSQLRAINMAANDVSFVLHGPPGTGKSQTITAMISNALTKGKTILFVAEKMAALEVVQKRLAALGIGEFCLELHSNKATKKAVLDQLKRGLEIGMWGIGTEYESKIADIKKMRENLDSYAQAIHQKRDFGKSLRELIDCYELIPECDKEVRFECSFAGALTQGKLDEQVQILERVVAAGRAVGHPAGHPLSMITQTVYTQSLKLDLEDTIRSYKSAIEEYQKDACIFTEQIGLSMPQAESEWEQVGKYAQSIENIDTIPKFLMKADSIEKESIGVLEYLHKNESLVSNKERLLKKWNENFLRMDMNIFRAKFEEAGKKLFGKGKALSMLVAELQSYALFAVKPENIPLLLTEITFYQEEEEKVKEAENSLSADWKVLLSKYISAQSLLTYLNTVKIQLETLKQFTECIRQLEEYDTLHQCVENAKKLMTDLADMQNKEKKAADLLQFSYDKTSNSWLQDKQKLCDSVLENQSMIKDWIVYRQFTQEAFQAGLAPICEAYNKGLEHDDVINVYMKSIYKAIILYTIEQEPALNKFTGIAFNERIEQFKKLDMEFMDLTKDEMYYKLTHQLPTGYESVEISRELNILRRAISSNGRGISIRSLFEQIPNALKKLCPCMLMSPISVAQYLSAENDLFDIVIFDEASQLPTCKAVGVLARGKNAVIVGDPNQMPPTSFFAGNTVDEDNLDIEDLDSILDDCLALGMPQAHLQWHYRSRHESLIAFSNQEFYENQMLTFPSVNDRERRVSLVKVDGFFDRGKGRVNQAEADAIIEEIKRRFKTPDLMNNTIGVVTFNITQQTLIEDMLQEEFRKNIEFDAWANSGDEPLFVKNLENVQGDERDVILFSVAFGPDAEGKLSMNFGPLNKDGGWKRLNVAVSRSRIEMLVFSIMDADMIDLRRTKSKGVEALKDFLEFAEKGKLQETFAANRTQKNQGIMNRICKELTNAGYEYQRSVGHSNFKIDIAVLNPYNKEEYLLGILLDGESYRQSANTKDREVSQPGVLNGLGWKLIRIWTMDWWDNRDKEISKLMNLLADRKNAAALIDTPNKQDAADIQQVKVATYSSLKNELKDDISHFYMEYNCISYQSAAVLTTPITTNDYVLKTSMDQIVSRLEEIVEIEAPVSYERLIKKTLRTFGIARASAQTIEATERALKKVAVKLNKQNGVKFYWKESQNPDIYNLYRIDVNIEDKRSLEDICQQELKNAVCKVLQENGNLSKENLIKETIHVMGYGRSGVALIDAVEKGIKYGRKTGEIVLDENKNFALING